MAKTDLKTRVEELHMYLGGIGTALEKRVGVQAHAAKRRHEEHMRTVELVRALLENPSRETS